MNLQHSRIAERCEALKLQRMAVEWPAVAAEAADSLLRGVVAASSEIVVPGPTAAG